MPARDADGACPTDAADPRQLLLTLLRQEPRGAAQRHGSRLRKLVETLERSRPADLAAPGALSQLEGVWELRWSSSRQPWLAVAPWLENLQVLAPSQGRAMNLLRPAGPLANLAGIAVEATIGIDAEASPAETSPAGPTAPRQRVQVRFRRGGWLGPSLGGGRLRLLRQVEQTFPAWLDITVLDTELRLCRGNAGTVFALVRRGDLSVEELLQPLS